jgi:ABC-type Co2+ transport system permease subunit
LAVRAIAAAVVAALAGLALNALVLTWLFPNTIGFESLLAIKAVYGAALAAIVTALMLRYALQMRDKT